MNRSFATWPLPESHWTTDERYYIVRRHMLKWAHEAEKKGWTETTHAIRLALLQIDHAKESAK